MLFGCNEAEQIQDDLSVTQVPDHLVGIDNLIVHESNQDPLYSIHFEKELEITNTDEHWIGSVFSFDVDSDNRIYIVSGHEIQVFDSMGFYMATLGGSGSGPGEFRSISIMKPVIQSNHLYVYDGSLQRINVYSLEKLDFSHTIVLSQENWSDIDELTGSFPSGWDYYIRDDGIILLGLRRSESIAYYPFELDGTIRHPVEKVFEQERTASPLSGIAARPVAPDNLPLPFDRRSLLAVSEDGHFISARTEDFLIEVKGPDGNHLRSIYYPFEKSLVDREAVLQVAYSGYDSSTVLTRQMRSVDFPESWPALAYMMVDDQMRIWVATITDDPDHYEWWVLDEFGQLLATFTWEGSKRLRHMEEMEIRTIRGNYLYTSETDETGLAKKIVRYRIDMEESE